MRRAVLLLAMWCAVLDAAITPPKFLARRDYGSSLPGAGPDGRSAVADINGDGIPDIVSVYPGSGDIYTLLGNGNGTFRSGPSIGPLRLTMDSVVLTDLNADGKIDLVVSAAGNVDGAGFAVFSGNGDGTFQSPVTYSVADSGVGWVEAGDFNNDGKPDVVLWAALGLWLFTGNGDGTFNPGVLTPVSNAAYSELVVADFNKDGKLDVAVGVAGSKPGFDVLLGNGDGTFQPPVLYRASAEPFWLAAGDLNNDGYPDVVTGTSVYLNKKNGTFAEPIAVNLPGPEFAIGDVNGDNIPDYVSSAGYVAFGLGNGKFEAPVYYPVQYTQPRSVALAHLRGPRLVDLVFGLNNGISVLLNQGKGTFEDANWTSVPGSGNCGAAADFNGDGIGDLAVPTSSGIVILLGTGNANAPFSTGTTLPLSSPGCPIAGDVNGDGIPDILEGAGSLGGVGVYLGNGDGTFRQAGVIPAGPANVLVLGDFNHDGKPDLATSSNLLALGNGDGTFQTPLTLVANPPPNGFGWIAAGDMNNDGWTDIVATEADGLVDIYVFLNNQHGGFTTATTVAPTGGVYTAQVADLNGDGNLDVVYQSLTAGVYLGDGKGGLKQGQSNIAFPGPDTIPAQIGDVNGDGIPDLILPADGSIGIAIGTGKGTFLPPIAFGAGPGEGEILLENLHGQSATAGLPDLVAPDNSGGVTVLINRTK